MIDPLKKLIGNYAENYTQSNKKMPPTLHGCGISACQKRFLSYDETNAKLSLQEKPVRVLSNGKRLTLQAEGAFSALRLHGRGDAYDSPRYAGIIILRDSYVPTWLLVRKQSEKEITAPSQGCGYIFNYTEGQPLSMATPFLCFNGTIFICKNQ